MKIVIVGGGTAGWLAAAMILKYTNKFQVTVIDSSKIPIIGAGEGATGVFPFFIRDKWPDNSINEMDFLRKTKATLKLGIRLKNWKGDGKETYSPFIGSRTTDTAIDSTFLSSILKYDRGDYSSFFSLMMDDKIVPFKKEGTRVVSNIHGYSYHFDGVEVGKYFKEWCLKRGAKLIDSEVVDIKFDDREHLQSVTLSNGNIIDSNFWLDCSGFARVLMSKTKNKWISYNNHLPVNSAITFSTEVNSKNVRFETLAEAMNAGWMWKIPLQNRNGCGYVYSDKFQSYDDIVNEIEKNLGHKIEPIKEIKFDSGRYEQIWYKNIVAIGLSSHFLEPLQATSIHMTIVCMASLIYHHLKSDVIYYENDRPSFNKIINNIVDDYKDLLQMHYLAGRQDTPFWKWVTNEMEISDMNKKLINISKFRTISPYDLVQGNSTPGYHIWSHILQNSGLYEKGMIRAELQNYGKLDEAFSILNNIHRDYKQMKPEMLTNEEFFKYLKL